MLEFLKKIGWVLAPFSRARPIIIPEILSIDDMLVKMNKTECLLKEVRSSYGNSDIIQSLYKTETGKYILFESFGGLDVTCRFTHELRVRKLLLDFDPEKYETIFGKREYV